MAQAPDTRTAASADASPLGLFGFATTLLVFSAANAHFTGVDVNGALGLALAYGGIAQFLAGMWELKNGNTFGGAAYSSYGAFWISFWVFSILLNTANSAPKGPTDQAWYLLAWTFVTLLFLIGALRLNWATVIFFALLLITFALLTIGAFNPPARPADASPIAGYFGLAATVVAYYLGLAGLLKATSGGKINLPVRPISS